MYSTQSHELKWNQIILDYQTSGLSMKEFCHSKGLRYHQFHHLKRKLSGKKTPRSLFDGAKVLDRSPAKDPPRVVIYYNDLSLALEGDQDLDLIARLCHKLGQA
jgi:hypothetical protein